MICDLLHPLLLIATILLLCASLSVHAAEPIRLESDTVRLEFGPDTGAWTGLFDKSAGNLVVEPAASIPTGLVAPRVDVKALDAAVAAGQALALEGEWRFAREPKKTGAYGAPEGAPVFAAAAFDDSAWDKTPVPSRPDVGDRKLHNQIGRFWYRTTVNVPAAWAGKDLALIVGAIDDFDETWFNGQCIGHTTSGTPQAWQTPRRYIIPANFIHFGQPNTLAICVINMAFDGGIVGPVRLGLAPALKLVEPEVKLLSYRVQAPKKGKRGDDGTLEMDMSIGAWRVHTAYELHRFMMIQLEPHRMYEGCLISRTFTIENASDKFQVLRGAGYALPALSAGPSTKVIFPDTRRVGDQPLEKLGPGFAAPDPKDGLIFLFSEEAKRGVGAWLPSDEEYAPVLAASTGSGAKITHSLEVTALLKPGEKAKLGTQHVWITRGSRDNLLDSAHSAFYQAGLCRDGVLARQSTWPRLNESIIYCAHPGGMPEHGFVGYGGFKALKAYIPTLQKMGVDILWLLPIFEHGDGKKWNLYSPFDHFKISPLYGTPEELKDLSDTAKAAGMRLMFDLVPHGPPDITPLAKEHPEWTCLDESGKPTYVWGQLAFDNAHPGWQDYMRRASEFNAKEYGVIGARIDCAAGSPLNWKPQPGQRPSFSTLGGGLGMCRAIREGFLKAQQNVVILPEEYTGARVFYRVADLTYDAQLFLVMIDLQAANASPKEWAATLQRFLHDQSLTLPPGAIKMRWTANHDTVSWTFQAKRTIKAYGAERSRALLALCCLIDGVPMIYQGEENPALYGGQGPSIVDDLAKIIACRKRLPALSRGAADYQSVQATGGVFACLRSWEKDKAIVLVSFNPEPVKTALTLPADLSMKTLKDEITGESIDVSAVPMANHQVRVLSVPRP
ncbi:MAG TPA: alpha-amylase family glycosyl hydrolase [Planctomycetota bacterium]|jgi:hypothetical protein